MSPNSHIVLKNPLVVLSVVVAVLVVVVDLYSASRSASLLVSIALRKDAFSEPIWKRVPDWAWKRVPFHRTRNGESTTTKRAATVSWNHQLVMVGRSKVLTGWESIHNSSDGFYLFDHCAGRNDATSLVYRPRPVWVGWDGMASLAGRTKINWTKTVHRSHVWATLRLRVSNTHAHGGVVTGWALGLLKASARGGRVISKPSARTKRLFVCFQAPSTALFLWKRRWSR